MAYITQQDLEDSVGGQAKLIQLTDDDRLGVVNVDAVNKAVAYAQGLLETYLRLRYTLPVTATEMVKGICIDLAIFKLRRRRPTSGDVYEDAKNAHDNAVKLLEKIGAGKAALDVPAAEETRTNPTSADEVLKGSSRPSPFSDDKLRSF
jgi:phage gp36-like protein